MSRTTESHPQQCSVYSRSIASSPGQTEYTHRRAHNMVKWSEVAQSCPTPHDPTDCSLPGSSVHGIFQARVLGWIAISSSRGSSPLRDWTPVSLSASREDAWKSSHASRMYHHLKADMWWLLLSYFCCSVNIWINLCYVVLGVKQIPLRKNYKDRELEAGLSYPRRQRICLAFCYITSTFHEKL